MDKDFSASTPEVFFRHVLKGHEDAVAFACTLCHVLHIWDDLEDGDKRLTSDDISKMMFAALVVLPRNRFYQANFLELNTMLDSAITNWLAANEMERNGNDADKRIAFVIRSNYLNIVLTAARIVGGHEWAVSMAPLMRRYWHQEGFDKYLENLATQFAIEKENSHVLQRT